MASPFPEPPAGRFTREAYYAWAEAQPRGRWEREDGEIVAMAPERVRHVRSKKAVLRALDDAIDAAGVACEAFGDGITVQIDEWADYEPDAVVHCGEDVSDDAIAAPNPIIVVEVTSPSNSRVDLTTKFTGYFRTASVQHYLIVHLAKRIVIHHRRVGPDRIETRMLAEGPLHLDPPGITVQAEALFGRARRPAP